MNTILLLIVMAVVAAPAGAVEILTVDGVPHIQNPDKPSGGSEDRRLSALWTTGGEDDEVFFGTIASAMIGPEGNIFLLDNQLNEIQVYSPDGEHLQTMGRSGEGPGEFNRPMDLVNLPGGRIGAIEQMPAKIVTFDADGTPGSSIVTGDPTAGRMGALWDAQGRGEHLVLAGQRINPGPSGMETMEYLTRFTVDGTEAEPYYTKDGKMDFSRAVYVEKDQYSLRNRWALGPDGTVYAPVDRDRYSINVYAPGGELVRVIEREFTPRKRTGAENDRIGRGMMIIVNGERIEMDREVEKTAPCIAGMFVDRDGRLWVEHANSRFTGDGVLCSYDVFDSEGRYVKQVDYLAEGDALADGLIALGDGRFVLVKGLTAAIDGVIAGMGNGPDGEGGAEADDSELEVVLLGTDGEEYSVR